MRSQNCLYLVFMAAVHIIHFVLTCGYELITGWAWLYVHVK